MRQKEPALSASKGFVHLILLLVISIALVGGYFLYKQGYLSQNKQIEKVSPETAPLFENNLYKSPDIKDGNVTFKYTLNTPDGWIINKHDNDSGNISIEKGSYILRIQSPTWSSYNCLYPGDGETTSSETGFESYTSYRVLNTSFGEVRMGTWMDINPKDAKLASFKACSKLQEDPRWSNPYWDGYMNGTKMGNISYEVPLPYDENIIKEMDSIVTSIDYQEL